MHKYTDLCNLFEKLETTQSSLVRQEGSTRDTKYILNR